MKAFSLRLVCAALCALALLGVGCSDTATRSGEDRRAAVLPSSGTALSSLVLAQQLQRGLELLRPNMPVGQLKEAVAGLRRACRLWREDLIAEATPQSHLVLAACLDLEREGFYADPQGAMARSYLELALSGETFLPRSRREAPANG